MSTLHPAIRSQLLAAARRAIAAEVAGEEPPSREDLSRIEHHGVFVTIRTGGRLRGCIGTFSPSPDLFETVSTMAVAAVHDPRFVGTPLGAGELADLCIDISILSPRRVLEDPLDVQIGVHGIYIRRGHQAGCFLPEVAAERGWDAATFLTECCRQKVGLDPRAWELPGTEVSVFTVEKVADEEPSKPAA